MAPSTFGNFDGDILVGDFGDGRINAFTPQGVLRGKLKIETNAPIDISGLWGLRFGNSCAGSSPNTADMIRDREVRVPYVQEKSAPSNTAAGFVLWVPVFHARKRVTTCQVAGCTDRAVDSALVLVSFALPPPPPR